MIRVDQIHPAGWRDLFTPGDPVAIGIDVATTTNRKSNPSAIAAVQKVKNDYLARLVLRFKSGDPDITEALVLKTLDLPHGLRARRVMIDATSERFFALNLRKRLLGKAICELVIASESITYLGESMNKKTYLGNLFVNTIEDGSLALPPEDWLEKDIRQVMRDRGTFVAEVDDEGNHADGFDAIKLALMGLIGASTGPVEARAAAVGTFAGMLQGKRWPVDPRRSNQPKHLF